jgi:hypothetical protein
MISVIPIGIAGKFLVKVTIEDAIEEDGATKAASTRRRFKNQFVGCQPPRLYRR